MKRFSFDLGSGSLGWAVYALDADMRHPIALESLGVRIFPTGRDPKTKESNASGRRTPRLQRRQNDRRKMRRARLADQLVLYGLMPPVADKEKRQEFFRIDPYQARGRLAQGRADLFDLGRALWHMSKHRGFKSNRKTDRANADDNGKIATASAHLRQSLVESGHATYGAFLADRHQKGHPVRVRLSGSGLKSAYDYYPTRDLLLAEFEHVWRAQAAYHPELTEEARQAIGETLFFQRPLKPVAVGRCTFFPQDERLPKWHPLAQAFLVLQQLNMVRLGDGASERPLTLAERNIVLNHLMSGEDLSYAAFRKALKIKASVEINLEKGGLKKLAHDATFARLVGSRKKPGPLAGIWPSWSEEKRLSLLVMLDEAQAPEKALAAMQVEFGLPVEIAEQVEKIVLPEGHLMLGERATRAITQVLHEEVVVYSVAVRLASERNLFGDGAIVHHSDLRPHDDPGFDRLPPYNEVPALQRMIGTGTGNPDDEPLIRFGKIGNPTVHVALGQFRRTINAMIDHFGKPDEIAIETTRDMAKSPAELKKIENEIKANTRRNDAWRAELEAAGILAQGAAVGDRFLRMRLWEELGKSAGDRLCPYTGQPIALHQLHSDAVEVDHILPFTETFDDSPANKTVCFRAANRIKAKRAPAQAWSGEEREAMIARVKGAPGMAHKLWRFLPGAMEKWEEQRGFEDRQLHATGYLARVVRAYAEALFPKDGTSRIWMPTGRMTAMMRRRWGLYLPDHNAKTRDDHRHHALDAAVVGVIDRETIRRLQTYARRIGAEELDRVLPEPPEPFAGFRDQVMARVSKLVVSHRPDHAVKGRLQEDTAYGLVRDVPENQADLTIGNVVVRKPVEGLSNKEIGQIRDLRIRESARAALSGLEAGQKPDEVLKDWAAREGYRRLRLIKPQATARPVLDATGKPCKWLVPGEIAYLDILEMEGGQWGFHAVDIWSAQQASPDAWKGAHPEARFIMRLFKNDTLQVFDLDEAGNPLPGSNRIKRVVGLEPSANRVRLAGCNEAGVLGQRHDDPDDPFRWDFANIGKLRARRARRVRVDELGRVHSVPHGVL